MANDGKSPQNETREEQCSFPSNEVHSGTSNFTTHRPIAVHPDLGEIEDGGVAAGVALRDERHQRPMTNNRVMSTVTVAPDSDPSVFC
jgi:hypothetical protein